MVEARKWLDEWYPKEGGCLRENERYKFDNYGKIREQITKLNISLQNLEGELDLSDFPNLEELYCSNNKLTSLNVSNCKKLVKVDCKYNNFPNQDLINKYGLCLKCYQPNTSEKWCQPCAEKEWKQLEGQELIERFIEQQKERSWYNKLQWIPYEEFTNIEHIADGGFGKIYKVKWETGKKKYSQDEENEVKDVVLKSLTNSQNITLDFLQEIANTKLVDTYGIVPCYGISQDPETKNYVMVMHYMEGGNLRDYLKNKYSEMSWEEKLGKLYHIAYGLKNIHKQNLVHRDFHSGNILNSSFFHESQEYLNSFITDLGLSKLVNSQTKEGEIMGVLPYVAPEVLRGQSYTQASDIYSFGIIAYELLANSYPYSEMDDLELSLAVCNGLRPDIDKVPIHQEIKDLIKKCWDADFEKRPSARELKGIVEGWCEKDWYEKIKPEYNLFSQNTPYQIHSNATTYSKMIDTRKITKRLETMGYSDGLVIDFTNQNWTNIHSSFTDELIQKWQNLNFTPELITQWESRGFSYQQTQDWINIGFQPTDYNFCAWLRDVKQVDCEWVLNYGNSEQLNQEFFTWWQEQQQSKIEIPPK